MWVWSVVLSLIYLSDAIDGSMMSPSIRRLLGCPVQMELISLGCVSWRYLRHSALYRARPQTRAGPSRIAPPFTGALARSIAGRPKLMRGITFQKIIQAPVGVR